MNIVFRVDSSIEIGSGHVMRCLTLAEQFKENNDTVEFICRKAEGSMETFIEDRGFRVYLLPKIQDSLWTWTATNWRQDIDETKQYLVDKKIDLVIVDHYAIDEKWTKSVNTYTRKILIIDDYRKKFQECDILLDPSYGMEGLEQIYKVRNPIKTRFFLGTKYTLLRNEFSNITPIDISSQKEKIIHIFFGSMDEFNYTLRFSKYLIESFTDIKLLIVVGPYYKFYTELQGLETKYNNRIKIYQNAQNMAELMTMCYMSIGAPGTATWERAAVGLPALYLSTAENQFPILKSLQDEGICQYIGDASKIKKEEFLQFVEYYINNFLALKEFSEKSKTLVNIKGKQVVVDEIIKILGG
ncbi:UDP-2,4-diacetamido-2,4,6-trideoxy-beta-L-altropyranose hydrolase [Rummeliibacillus sp. NPDC094406]|uniref:UDP-2,4-diacetamido-2,4, 6-trideoxy-beta-L-altropyranose hydrolase n=1 Tax=Rummeliibacillus sp. NPDC094406 TaxID=3364511 RepID=UPI0038090FBC